MTERSASTDDRLLYLVTSSVSLGFLRDQVDYFAANGSEILIGTSVEGPTPELAAEIIDLAFEREPSPPKDARALWQVCRLIRQRRPTLVNAATPKAGLIGMLAAYVCRVPRRVYVVWGLRFETLSGNRRRLFRWLERLATAAATDVVYNSPSLLAVAERERAVKRGRGVALGHGSGNCVCMSRFDDLPDPASARRQLGLPSDEIIVGFVGRLTRDKGVVDLVEAIEQSPAAHLVLVGDFEAGDPVPDSVRSTIGSSPHITHVPWLDDVRLAYSAMDLLAFASYREGLPNVPIEAQRSGVPVVGYRATGTIDAVREGIGGYLVDVGDRRALAEQLALLVANPDLRRRLGEQGRSFATTHFAPDACWDHLAELYGSGPSR